MTGIQYNDESKGLVEVANKRVGALKGQIRRWEDVRDYGKECAEIRERGGIWAKEG